jgi:sugar phosphate isomerase/epimerase
VRTTYCGNVHAATDLDGWLRTHREHAAPIAQRRRRAGQAFGLGAWWSAPLAARLATRPDALAAVRDALAESGTPVWTCNAFPAGAFHEEGLKGRVYEPGWERPERLAYTLDVARVAVELAESEGPLAISTVPIGPFTTVSRDATDQAAAHQLGLAADRLEDLAERTGVDLVLALEPEPCARLERVAECVAWLGENVFGRAPDAVAARRRRRIGVCVDLCHLAVVGEEPLAALDAALRAGVRVPKIQVSVCPEARTEAALDALFAFDEPRFLHQTFASGGSLRALDLGEARARRAEFVAAIAAGRGPVRTHFHVPVFWRGEGGVPGFGSTRSEVERLLAALPRIAFDEPPLLEIETYTWSVLAEEARPRDAAGLIDGLLREFSFVDGVLGRSVPDSAG